jgi:cell pole-organizing protein PopZ
MAQASSVQREPSMEEILSSIRRIIEDSDSGSKNEQSLDGTDEVQAKKADAQTGSAQKTASGQKSAADKAAGASVAPAPKSLADIQKEIAGEKVGAPVVEANSGMKSSSETADDLEKNSEPPPHSEKNAEVQKSAVDVHLTSGNADEQSAGGDAAKPLGAEATERQASAKEVNEVKALPRDSLPVKTVGETEVRPDSRKSSGGPIISPDAGRRVAASFEQLSEVFMENRAKAFDSMAEEMLRPMLQEWLDENLPTLVERLVREEIERVARGGN